MPSYWAASETNTQMTAGPVEGHTPRGPPTQSDGMESTRESGPEKRGQQGLGLKGGNQSPANSQRGSIGGEKRKEKREVLTEKAYN